MKFKQIRTILLQNEWECTELSNIDSKMDGKRHQVSFGVRPGTDDPEVEVDVTLGTIQFISYNQRIRLALSEVRSIQIASNFVCIKTMSKGSRIEFFLPEIEVA